MRPVRYFALCAVLCLPVLSCGGGGTLGSGGGGTTPPAANVVGVIVDAGPVSTAADVNTLFTTVTVCVPGTTNCQTIDHIQVDTGSYGLRLLASVLTLNLPVQTTAGSSLLECTQFVDGYSWGPVVSADVKISGELASSVPVQVIGDPNFTNVPVNCSNTGPPEDTVAQFGANGLLGIGVFAQDCGSQCVGDANVDNGVYYACAASAACQPTAVAALTNQVTNPVVLFSTDNNGVIIQLPSVAAQGAATVSGSMIFGIDTQSNNKSGSQAVLTVDTNVGDFTTVFNGQTLTQSFLDTGSNGFYFNDPNLPACADSNFAEFYCPSTTQNLTATLEGLNGMSTAASFSVADAESLGANDSSLVAFGTLAGSTSLDTSFDWGLPFYYGRSVYTVVENAATSVGTGPYIAF